MVKIHIPLMLKSIAIIIKITKNIGEGMEIYQGLSEGMKKQSMEETLLTRNIALTIPNKMWPSFIFTLLLLLMTSLAK